MYGELQPRGGGDPIPLLKTQLLVGRRESSDIVLRFPNVSGRHCELFVVNGYWFVKDLGSSNGTKVNGVRVTELRLDPGDMLAVARHKFEICYEPSKLGLWVRILNDAHMHCFTAVKFYTWRGTLCYVQHASHFLQQPPSFFYPLSDLSEGLLEFCK